MALQSRLKYLDHIRDCTSVRHIPARRKDTRFEKVALLFIAINVVETGKPALRGGCEDVVDRICVKGHELMGDSLLVWQVRRGMIRLLQICNTSTYLRQSEIRILDNPSLRQHLLLPHIRHPDLAQTDHSFPRGYPLSHCCWRCRE